MHQLASPGPDGNSGAMGGNSGADGRKDPELLAARFGHGGWSSPKTSGLTAVDRRNE